MATFKSIRPYDFIFVGDRRWRVEGVYVGALNHETVVELSTSDGKGHDGVTLMVPLDLIPSEAIFRAVDHEAEKRPRLTVAA